MGMIMIVLWGLYVLPAIGIYKLTKRYSVNKWVHRSVLAILILIPTYDIIITNILAEYYCLNTPSTYINKKVEYPESIYFEDNILGGFDADERKLMIVNYLDGVHLKTMALNGDDGKAYVYEAGELSLLKQYNQLIKKRKSYYLAEINKARATENRVLEKQLIQKNIESSKKAYKALDSYVNNIFRNHVKIYNKSSMPKTNYTVTFNEIKLNPLSRKFLYADETKIIYNKSNEVIAYNRQYMPFFYNITFGDKWNTGEYYSQWAWETCGWHQSNTQYFFKNVFEKIHINSGAIAESFNSKLYGKYTKGENNGLGK